MRANCPKQRCPALRLKKHSVKISLTKFKKCARTHDDFAPKCWAQVPIRLAPKLSQTALRCVCRRGAPSKFQREGLKNPQTRTQEWIRKILVGGDEILN